MSKKKKDIDQEKISQGLGKCHSAQLGSDKRFYCPRCDVFVYTRVGMMVPRHDCGRQLRPAWREDFERQPD